MLVQKPYEKPYIPTGPQGLPYVGKELEELTSATPFWRGQGEPIYAWNDQPQYLDQYHGAYGNTFRDRISSFGKKATKFVQDNRGLINPPAPSPVDQPLPQIVPTDDSSSEMSLGVKIGLGVGAVAIVGLLLAVALKE